MIVNLGKFQSIIIDKKKQGQTKQTFEIRGKVIEASPSVKLLGVQIDDSYFYSNFNYCPLVWMFSNAKSLDKIESLHKRALRYLYSDHESPYDTLLAKPGKVTIKQVD